MRAVFLLAFVLGACSPDGGGRPGRDGGGTDAAFDTNGTDIGPRPDSNIDAPGECVADTYMAESALQPVDIVWIIDNSGSMSDEAGLVQEQMNEFVTTISGAGLDVHVVVITAPGFVNVPAPLGTDPSQFLRVEEDVQSHDGLQKLISTFGRYSSFLRPTAAMHFIAVTDDESDLGADSFQSQMTSMLARTWRLHSIVSPPGSTHSFGGFTMPGCSGPRDDAADNGDEYWEVSLDTGGRTLSICSEDWTSLFSELATSIAIPMTLPCVYELPPPPDGEELDPGFLNLRYTPGGGSEETVPNVGSFDRCTGEGWYYEGDPSDPERILLCPNTCRRLELDATGRVDIAVGCATVLI